MVKKRILYFVSLVFLFSLFFIPDVVNAKSLGTCTYTIDTSAEKLILGDAKEVYLTATVNDDGTVTDTYISIDGEKHDFMSEEESIVFPNGIYLANMKEFKKDGKFYKSFKRKNNCPSIQVVNYINMNQLALYVEGGVDPEDNQSIVISTSKTGVSGPEATTGSKTIYCTRGPKKVRKSSKNVTIEFSETNGVKSYKITSDSKKSDEVEFDRLTTIDNVMFRVNSDDVSKFWSKSCKSYQMYFNALDGDIGNIVIQTTVPDTNENGSYSDVEAKYDDGDMKSNNNKNTNKGLNQKFDNCNQIFDMTEGHFGWLLQKLLNYIKIAGPVLVVLLSALDFIKAIASSSEDAFKKAQSRLVIRLIAALALFLVPTLVELLLGLINGLSDPTCGFK